MLPHSLSFTHIEATSPAHLHCTTPPFKQSNKRNFQTSYSFQETLGFKTGSKSTDESQSRKSVNDGVRFCVELSTPIVGFSLQSDQSQKGGQNGGVQMQRTSASLLSEQLGSERRNEGGSEGVGLRELERSSSWTSIRTLQAEERQLWYNTQLQYPVFGTPLAKEAFCVAARAFRNQKRMSGEPVLTHAVETAKILAELGCNEKMVAIALLHDVLDDTEMTESMLAEFVPRDIVDKVLDVSKLSTLSQLHRNAWAQTSHMSHMSTSDATKISNLYIAMADVEAVIVKLADRLHNMKTVHALPIFKRLRFSRETLDIFVPVANRLGIWSLKSQLEDLCFEQLHPEEFKKLKGIQNEDISRGDVERCLETLQKKLAEKKIQVEDLYGRTKSLYSVFSKLQKKQHSNNNNTTNFLQNVENLYDLRAIRIIVRNKQDCYQAARQVERLWEPLPGRYKDYIRHPKENGYQSVHLVVKGCDGVPLEVQIRTAKMHYLAEYGVAAHWRYKEEKNNSSIQNFQDEQEAVIIRYKRWLTQNLKLYDMKCRPYNGTTFEHSFDSLGLDSDNLMKCESAPSVRGGGGGDAFTRYMQQHKLIPCNNIEQDTAPVTVVCSMRGEDDSVSVQYQTCPPKATARQLLDRYSSSELSSVQLFINSKQVVNFEQELQNGDVIELQQLKGYEQKQEASSESLSFDSTSTSSNSKMNLDVQLLDIWKAGFASISQKEKGQQQFEFQTC